MMTRLLTPLGLTVLVLGLACAPPPATSATEYTLEGRAPRPEARGLRTTTLKSKTL